MIAEIADGGVAAEGDQSGESAAGAGKGETGSTIECGKARGGIGCARVIKSLTTAISTVYTFI